MSAVDIARYNLVVSVADLERRLFVIENDGRDEISLNDVWAMLKPVKAAIKEIQDATIEVAA